ncbi:S-adenosyl-L-methionine-dependent methyltransferase [Mycena rosella]|uniref:S-adenosyl-L-methionine-dependent methyltransferase n=1 Tax=Mycena rosella TaxID=1033263 RepID=A0AAD7G960_MYCRO|nr:S-adenosyl-L-methionine-dependent methyltransferase [Mycena rosella]
MKALEFYSGIGGLHLALSQSNAPASVTHAFDWDQNACEVYSANFGPGITKKMDISTLTASYLAQINASLWLLSPACQPYTVLNPSAKGGLDPRATSFLHLVQDVLPELARVDAHPTHFLVENVGGFENSSTRHVLVSTLRSLEYTTLRYIPGRGDATWVDLRLVDPESNPDDTDGIHEIREYLDPEPVEGYGIPDKRSGSILKMNEEQDVVHLISPQSSSTSADAVRTLDTLRLQYFSPEELLRLFSFTLPRSSSDPPEQTFIWPEGISRKTKYLLIGNINLIQYLFEEP